MKSVTADFNRRGSDGALKVSLRRFSEAPSVGDSFIAEDGDERYVGWVKAVDTQARTVLMDMAWDQSLRRYLSSAISQSSRRTAGPSGEERISNS